MGTPDSKSSDEWSTLGSDTTWRLQGSDPVRSPRLVRVAHSPDPALVGRTFPLDGSAHPFGRRLDGDDRIRDPHLSRRHFRLVPRDGDYVVEDLRSANGTFVNGRRLESPVVLEPGDVVCAGQTIWVEESEPDHDALPVAPDAEGELVHEIVGISTVADRMRRSIATVAASSGSVLILGQTGVGKEVTARAIHRLSRRPGPLVPVNCAAVPADLAEAEFFGYRKGAFTGADTDRDGYFVQADGGTLFLDEVGDLPPLLQAKLLRVLEDQWVHPVGGGRPVKVEVRILAATLVDLDEGSFRRDLMARLGSWVLRLPSLAQRRSDILPLWRHLTRAATEGQPPAMEPGVAQALVLYEWPLNVRELQSVALRALQLRKDDAPIELGHLPASVRQAADDPKVTDEPAAGSSIPSRPLADIPPASLEGAPSREELLRIVESTRGNVRRIAADGGWLRAQVYRWIRRYQIDLDAYR